MNHQTYPHTYSISITIRIIICSPPLMPDQKLPVSYTILQLMPTTVNNSPIQRPLSHLHTVSQSRSNNRNRFFLIYKIEKTHPPAQIFSSVVLCIDSITLTVNVFVAVNVHISVQYHNQSFPVFIRWYGHDGRFVYVGKHRSNRCYPLAVEHYTLY